jgi:hypothetical protein
MYAFPWEADYAKPYIPGRRGVPIPPGKMLALDTLAPTRSAGRNAYAEASGGSAHRLIKRKALAQSERLFDTVLGGAAAAGCTDRGRAAVLAHSQGRVALLPEACSGIRQ